MAASADPVAISEPSGSPQKVISNLIGSFNSLSSGQWQIYISDDKPISSKQKWKERDPVSIERSNLVNICKLVVKELIESSLKSGRQLDSDSVPLQHFFIVLEHVLRHGLKPKRGLLGPKKELWDLFQLVERWSVEAQDITASVRDLPTVNTALGRARAWLRLALMQKKLADYFRLLLERRDDLLVEFYEPGSLMLADEAVVIMGLLVGLNVVDCNLCVKEEDLDSQMGVIDFSLYLRRGPICSPGSEVPPAPSSLPPTSSEQHNLTTVLDQKNYIEELNRHLNATVSNLQARLESLTTTNALMKEDLSIARTSLAALQEENDSLRQERGLPTAAQQQTSEREVKRAARISVIGCEEELQDLKRQLEEESAHRKQVECELELQVQMKAESEMAAKLLEKDIHEKQDTIVSLRRQLEDIKTINLEMYQKLQECEVEIAEKGLIVARLQEKTVKISSMLMALQAAGDPSESHNSTHGHKGPTKGHAKRASLRETYKVSDIEFNWDQQKDRLAGAKISSNDDSALDLTVPATESSGAAVANGEVGSCGTPDAEEGMSAAANVSNFSPGDGEENRNEKLEGDVVKSDQTSPETASASEGAVQEKDIEKNTESGGQEEIDESKSEMCEEGNANESVQNQDVEEKTTADGSSQDVGSSSAVTNEKSTKLSNSERERNSENSSSKGLARKTLSPEARDSDKKDLSRKEVGSSRKISEGSKVGVSAGKSVPVKRAVEGVKKNSVPARRVPIRSSLADKRKETKASAK